MSLDKVNELRAAKAKLVNESRALLDRAEEEKRELSAEERASYDKIWGDIESLTTRIKDEERQTLAEAEMNSFAPAPSQGQPQGKTPTKEEQRLKAFRRYLAYGQVAEAEYRALANDTDAAGGYLHAAEEFVAQLLKGLDDSVFVRQHATMLKVTSSDELGIPTLAADISDPNWTTEIAQVSEDSDLSFGHRSLKPVQLSKRIKVSQKLLLTSALPVEQIVSERMAYKFAVAQEKAFLTGSGSGQPLGVFTASPNGVPAARDVSAENTATAITANGILNVTYAMKSSYRNKARWVFHRDAVKMLAKLVDSEGQYLWRTGLVSGQPDMLCGIPLDESEYVPNTFTTGLYVGALCCWQYYYIAELQGMWVQRLNELYAETSQIGFIGRGYWDAAPVLPEAFVRVKLG